MKKLLLASILLASPAFCGDTFDGYAVECSSAAWAPLRDARAMPRRFRAQILDSSAGGVCISTVTASGTACEDSTPGVELSTGTAGIVSIDILTRARLNCRNRADVPAQRVKGYEGYNAQ